MNAERTAETGREKPSGPRKERPEVSRREDGESRERRIKVTNLQREALSEKYSNSRYLVPVS